MPLVVCASQGLTSILPFAAPLPTLRRIHTTIGAPCRLWHPWFVAMREQEGLGWLFEKTDRQRINERVQLLVNLFVRDRTAKQLALPFDAFFGPLHDRRVLAINDR